MNILITGASGFIGRHMVKKLEGHNHNLTLCSRTASGLYFTKTNSRFVAIDYNRMSRLDDWLPYLQGIDIVINCVGIIVENKRQRFKILHTDVPIALFHAAVQSGVKRIIQISSLGADESAASAYHLSKKAADDALRSMNIDWVVIQPAIVYGEGAQSMALFQAMAALPFLTLIDQGTQLLQPVFVDDVVDTVDLCVEATKPIRKTLPVVGATALSYAELLRCLRKRLGKKPAQEVSLPGSLVEKLAVLGKLLNEPELNAENIAMLRRGNYANTETIDQFLGHSTQAIEQQLLSIPATQAGRWHAGLYFLRPVLRLGIAFVWIWSGLVSIFFYPHEKSFEFLAATHITGIAAQMTLYGLALLDIVLGVTILVSQNLRPLIQLQLMLIFLYTVIISVFMPEFWFHPFGPVLKNIPLLITLLVQLPLEGEKP